MNERPFNYITYIYTVVKIRILIPHLELQLLVYVFLPYLSNLLTSNCPFQQYAPCVIRIPTSFSVSGFIQNRSKTKILLTINSIIKKLFLNLNVTNSQMLLFHIRF